MTLPTNKACEMADELEYFINLLMRGGVYKKGGLFKSWGTYTFTDHDAIGRVPDGPPHPSPPRQRTRRDVPQHRVPAMTDDQIKHMVDRFLQWKLPADFNPDNGISAVRPNYGPNVAWEPVGTNLLSYMQAEAMVRHMVEGLRTPAPPVTREAVLEEAARFNDDNANRLAAATPEGHPDKKARDYAIGALIAAADGIRALKSEPVVDQEEGPFSLQNQAEAATKGGPE